MEILYSRTLGHTCVGFTFPQVFAQPIDNVLSIVTDIQAKVNNASFGLAAIKTAVDTKASQTSVNNLQTTANAIKTKTDILPSDPASNSHVDAAIASIGAGMTEVQVPNSKMQLCNNQASCRLEWVQYCLYGSPWC